MAELKTLLSNKSDEKAAKRIHAKRRRKKKYLHDMKGQATFNRGMENSFHWWHIQLQVYYHYFLPILCFFF